MIILSLFKQSGIDSAQARRLFVRPRRKRRSSGGPLYDRSAGGAFPPVFLLPVYHENEYMFLFEHIKNVKNAS